MLRFEFPKFLDTPFTAPSPALLNQSDRGTLLSTFIRSRTSVSLVTGNASVTTPLAKRRGLESACLGTRVLSARARQLARHGLALHERLWPHWPLHVAPKSAHAARARRTRSVACSWGRLDLASHGQR
eukprot:2379340-Pleurochrysis_carterae.AAC.1